MATGPMMKGTAIFTNQLSHELHELGVSGELLLMQLHIKALNGQRLTFSHRKCNVLVRELILHL